MYGKRKMFLVTCLRLDVLYLLLKEQIEVCSGYESIERAFYYYFFNFNSFSLDINLLNEW